MKNSNWNPEFDHFGADTPLLTLIRQLQGETRTLVREEVALVKAELKEKFSRAAGHMIWVGVGAVAALMGILVTLFGLATLLAFGFQLLGMIPEVAAFVGPITLGTAVLAAGSFAVFKGIKALSNESLAPKKALQALTQHRGEQPLPEIQSSDLSLTPLERPSIDEIATRIDSTRARIHETVVLIRKRLTANHWKKTVAAKIRSNLLRSAIIGAATGCSIGFLILRKRLPGRDEKH